MIPEYKLQQVLKELKIDSSIVYKKSVIKRYKTYVESIEGLDNELRILLNEIEQKKSIPLMLYILKYLPTMALRNAHLVNNYIKENI